LFEPALEQAIRPSSQFVSNQKLEKLEIVKARASGLFQTYRQCLHEARQAEMTQLSGKLWIHVQSSNR
jgi:hypothetical protein